MPKCSKCGADIKEGSGFCSKCGNKIEAEAKSQNQPEVQTKTQTQTPSAAPSATPTQTEAPKKKKSTGVKILLGCLIAFVVVAIVGGIVGYILVKKGIKKAQDEIKKAEEEWTEGMGGWEEIQKKGEEELEKKQKEMEDELEKNLEEESKTNTNEENSSAAEEESTKPSQKASKVVEEFMSCTLGTIPQKCSSDNKDEVAKKHLTLEMRTDYNSSGFIPTTYCIQEGPNDVRIDSEYEDGGFAYVMVSAKYGSDDFQPFWNFILVVQDGEWKIKEIQCLNF